MTISYSTETIRALERKYSERGVLRPLRVSRYEPGTILEYEVEGVVPRGRASVKLEIEKFAGGGFAGQVYKVRLVELSVLDGQAAGLEKGRLYAIKIFVPPSGFSRKFRNFMYGIGFQGPFSLQSNRAAGRSQALWQKFIRRAARVEFGSEECAVEVIATFVDGTLGSRGEILEWIDGRTWRLEVDDNLDDRRSWKPGDPEDGVGSPEYRSKYAFMDRFVKLMHKMGAVELARQYEWWSLKSQPNVLKREASDPDPRVGLTAVDFRAGLALMPEAPMSPVDVKLIFRGLARGSLVQFDRGDFKKLDAFIAEHPADFSDMGDAAEELKSGDRAYRESLPDIFHHHVRLFGRKLRKSIMGAMRESWNIRKKTDERTGRALERSGLLSAIFLFLPFLSLAAPALFVFAFPGRDWWKYPVWLSPLLAPFVRRLWGREDDRRHYGKMLTSLSYFLRAGRARIAETLIRWVRSGRVSEARALKLVDSPLRFYTHTPLSILPAGLHRFFSDKDRFRQKLYAVFVRPVRLYFRPEEREKWLRDMTTAGEKNGLLTREEAAHIEAQIKEPFIQKYLKSLAIHLLLMPTTHVVALIVAFIYVRLHPEMTWQQASLATGVILGLFQIIPVSPGSIARGIYTTSLILRERNFKDYSIAFWLSFFKYIGYFAFPIQMAYRYPDLARFMAGHWATTAVHAVPVFGEKGAWLEHFVFDTFYNFPLTIRRRIRLRREARANLEPRYAHILVWLIAGTGVLAALDFSYFKIARHTPQLGDIWWIAIWVPLFASVLICRGAGGAAAGKRIAAGTVSGAIIGLFYVVVKTTLPPLYAAAKDPGPDLSRFAIQAAWHVFLFAIVAVIGAAVAETRKV